MKKKIAIAAIVASLGLVSVNQAMAKWGHPNNVNNGYCPCAQTQGVALDQATQDKIAAFYDANQDIQKQIVVKNAELRALMRSDNPDSSKVATLTGELFDLRTTLQNKAEEAGIDQYVGRGMMGQGQGFGKGGMRGGQGQGRMMGGGRF